MTPTQCAAAQAEIDHLNAANAVLQADIPVAQAALDVAQASVIAAQARVTAATLRMQSDVDMMSANNGMIRQIQMQMRLGGCSVNSGT